LLAAPQITNHRPKFNLAGRLRSVNFFAKKRLVFREICGRCQRLLEALTAKSNSNENSALVRIVLNAQTSPIAAV
jgi:hypothetical protein